MSIYDKWCILCIVIHQIVPLPCDWWNCGMWPNNVHSSETLSANNARSQPITPSGEQTLKWSVFIQFTDEEIRRLVEKAVPESTKKSMCFASCFVLFCATVFAMRGNIWRIIKTINYFWLPKYARIVVLGHYLFLEAHSCLLLWPDNISDNYPCIFPHPK